MDTSGHPKSKKRAKAFLSTEKGRREEPRELQTSQLNFDSLEQIINLFVNIQEMATRWEAANLDLSRASHSKPTHLSPKAD